MGERTIGVGSLIGVAQLQSPQELMPGLWLDQLQTKIRGNECVIFNIYNRIFKCFMKTGINIYIMLYDTVDSICATSGNEAHSPLLLRKGGVTHG